MKNVSETIFIYKSLQPFNGLSRMVAAVSSKAELEPGFSHWFAKLSTIAKEAGIPISFHASVETIKELEEQNRNTTSPVKAAFNPFHNWEEFLFLSRELKPDDLFVIVASRKGHVSHNSQLDTLPY